MQSDSSSTLGSTLPRRLRVLIVGGGLSGLTLANGLLNAAPFLPLEVTVFEKDQAEYLRERGGYQIRLAQDGISSLRECLDDVTYAELKCRYGAGVPEAPTLMDPKTAEPLLRFSSFRIYAKARAMSRGVLRAFLLRKVVASNAIRFSRRVVAYDIVYDQEGEHVKIFFDDGTFELGDVLVAADGSKSNIADQMGLNNRTHVHGGYHIASRGPVNDVVLAKLPPVLQNDGAVSFFGSGIFGFISTYRTEDPGDLTTVLDKPYYQDPHIYWAISFPGHISPRFNSASDIDLKTAQRNHAKELMRSKGIHQSIIDILDIGPVDTVRLTAEMETSVQPPHNWRELAQRWIGKNGGHPRVFLIGDSMHPMTPGRGMGANQALRDAADLLPFIANLARSFQNASPEEICQLVQLTSEKFESEMLPRAFGWVNASNRSAEMDVSTWKGKAFIYILWIIMSVAGCLTFLLESIGWRKSSQSNM